MTARLLACPSCARHVRVTEARCPFCRAALADGFGAAPVPLPPPPGLGRYEQVRYGRMAAAVSVSVLAAAALVGCEVGNTIGPGTPLYGAPGGPVNQVPASCCGDVYFTLTDDECNCTSGESFLTCNIGVFSECTCTIPVGYTPYVAGQSCDGGATVPHDAGSDAKMGGDAHEGG
jgi:hypothetical protein